MTAQLTFQLPEEQREHLCAVHGRELVSIIWDLHQAYRSIIKYSSAENDPLIPGMEYAQKLLLEHLESAGLSNLIFEDI